MFVVGLTGGIGSGKSSVSAMFAELGINIVDADVAARIVVEPGTPALKQIAEHFGDSVMTGDGALDRTALRRIVFESDKARGWLERLLHPLIDTELKNRLRSATSPYAILCSPLLIETGQHKLANRIAVVDVPEHLQIERTMERDDNDETQIKAIMAAQIDRNARLNHADDMIDNQPSPAKVKKRVKELHNRYLKLAE